MFRQLFSIMISRKGVPGLVGNGRTEERGEKRRCKEVPGEVHRYLTGQRRPDSGIPRKRKRSWEPVRGGGG